eukprot:2387826-Alexandrium_andersonii.AAC.1
MAVARSQGQLAGVLFVDIKGAFDAIVRQTIFGASSDDTSFARLLEASVPTQFRAALRAIVERAPILSPDNIDGHLLALLANAHKGCWYYIEGSTKVAETVRGSKQ